MVQLSLILVRRTGRIFGLLYLDYISSRILSDSLISLKFMVYIPKAPLNVSRSSIFFVRALRVTIEVSASRLSNITE